MARRIPLGELCISKVATLPNGFDDIIDYIDISSVDNESKAIVAHQEIEGTEAPSRARQLLEVGDVLVSTVRPNLNAVAFVETAYKHTLICFSNIQIDREFRDICSEIERMIAARKR